MLALPVVNATGYTINTGSNYLYFKDEKLTGHGGTFNLSIQVGEQGRRTLRVWGQPHLYRKLQSSQGYSETLPQKTNKQQQQQQRKRPKTEKFNDLFLVKLDIQLQ